MAELVPAGRGAARVRARPTLKAAFVAAWALVVALPLVWVAARMVEAGAATSGWRGLADDLQWPRALALTLITGLGATGLSCALAAFILARAHPHPGWPRVVRALAPLLATPHAAFAIGFAFLIAPSGWLLRSVSPALTGLADPPPWPLTQDPWGLGLIAVLVAKEVPYLLWSAASHLQREDVRDRWLREWRLAQTLGYGPRRAWWRVVWPQLAPRLLAPALAVLAYSLTVVDMALVIGPSQPPTLSVLAWQWLLDAEPATQAQGGAAAALLALVVAGSAGMAWLGVRRQPARRWWTQGDRGAAPRHLRPAHPWSFALLAGLYGLVFALLGVASVAGSWPFPDLWPEQWTASGWAGVWASANTLGHTLGLALASAAMALLWSLVWLELAPAAADRRLRALVYLPLLLPGVLWVIGLHRLTLDLGLDGHSGGVLLTHGLACLPYVLIALTPAFTGYDARYGQVAASLGHSRLHFVTRVKWPMLRASLASALAVGVGVSVAQYLPTLYVGAGRVATVTTEAVTLASGGQRSMLAAFAWLQWTLPVLAFAIAARAGRPRRFARAHPNPGTGAALPPSA